VGRDFSAEFCSFGLRIAYETAIGPYLANTSGASSDARGVVRATLGIHHTLQMATNPVASSWTSLVTNSPTDGTFNLHRPRRDQPQPFLPGGETAGWGTKPPV